MAKRALRWKIGKGSSIGSYWLDARNNKNIAYLETDKLEAAALVVAAPAMLKAIKDAVDSGSGARLACGDGDVFISRAAYDQLVAALAEAGRRNFPVTST